MSTATATAPKKRGRPARRTSQARKQAPKTKVRTEAYVDERKAIATEALVKLREKGITGVTTWYGDPKVWKEMPEVYTRMGYVACILPDGEGTEKQLNHKGDPLFYINAELAQDRIDTSAREAAEMLQDAEDGEGYGATDAEGGHHGLVREED